jgi:NADPH:quinone reductase
MRAVVLKKYGSFNDLQMMDIRAPSPDAGQVRVKVYASAVGPADYKVAMGAVKFLHGRKFPLVLGYDFSGVVDAVGAEEARWKVGDEVFGFLPYGPKNNQGAFGELLIVGSGEIAKKPTTVSHAQAAAAATAGLTALQAFRDCGHLPTSNSRVLVTGVSGAVGAIGILIAQKLGAQVTALGSKAGLDLARRYGVTDLIDRNSGNIFERAKAPYDIIFDASAAYRWQQWKGHLKKGGTFVTTLPSLGFAIDKIASLISSTATQMVFVKAKTADLELLGKWLSEGLEIAIDSTFPVRNVVQGFQRYENGGFLGRIVIDVENKF